MKFEVKIHPQDFKKMNIHISDVNFNSQFSQKLNANNIHSPRWSPMYQYLALTSLRDTHPLPPTGDFSSHFRISVSVLRFPHFSVFHLPTFHYSGKITTDSNFGTRSSTHWATLLISVYTVTYPSAHPFTFMHHPFVSERTDLIPKRFTQ